jgi:NADH-quinone oxidoreductase subunit C
MIPEFVAALGASQVVPMEHAATGVVASITLAPDTILGAVAILDREGYLLEDVMASDLKEGFEIAYHFSLLDGQTRLVLRLTVPHDAPQVPSIAGIFPGADWHERECFDFFGIDFTGHPNLHYLLLPEDTEGHPLVKADKARKPLTGLMPRAWLMACGLAVPEEKAEKKPAAAAKED